MQRYTLPIPSLATFVTFIAATPAQVQWKASAGGNDHYYEVVSFATSWSDARAKAEARKHAGLTGYLATITSAAENAFLLKQFGSGKDQSVWIGASDSAKEGEWKWVTGPERDAQFWQGGLSGKTTAPFHFANWGATEPNNSNNNEDLAVFALGQFSTWARPGQWLDANNLGGGGANVVGYLVEYSPSLTANTRTISIANGGKQTFTLNAGSGLGSKLYWIFGSMTGTAPGVVLTGIHIPLVPDPYTDIVIGTGNSKEFTNFKGTLSTTGTATASLNVAAKLSIPTGFKLYHAYLVYDQTSGQIFTSSNPVSVEFK